MSPNLNSAASRRALIAKLMSMQTTTAEAGMVDSLERLCRAAVHNLDVDGAAVSMMVDAESPGVVAGANPLSLRMEEFQFTSREGPSLDSFASRRPVLTADLDALTDGQWLGFASDALGEDMHGVFCFPVQVGAITLGVFTVYRSAAGSLDAPASTMAITFAEVATDIILDGDPNAKPGRLHPGLQTVWDHRVQIYQAQGVVMVDLGVSLAEALIRMRAHAFANDQTLAEIANSVMSGALVFEAED